MNDGNFSFDDLLLRSFQKPESNYHADSIIVELKKGEVLPITKTLDVIEKGVPVTKSISVIYKCSCGRLLNSKKMIQGTCNFCGNYTCFKCARLTSFHPIRIGCNHCVEKLEEKDGNVIFVTKEEKIKYRLGIFYYPYFALRFVFKFLFFEKNE